MADSKVSVEVQAEVQLVPDEKTRDWLVSLGWTPPKEEASCTCNSRDVRDGEVVHYDDCELIPATNWDCDRCGKSQPSSVQFCPCPKLRGTEDGAQRQELNILYYSVVASMIAAGKEDLDKLLAGLGVDMDWLLGQPLIALTGAEAWDLQQREREAQRDGH